MAKRVIFFGLLISLFVLHGQTQAQISSDFAANADGWTAPGASGGIVYSATGGNPNGYVGGTDPITAGPPIFWYFSAPAKFLNNRCASYGKTLTFDLYQSATGTLDTTHPDVVLIGGGVTLNFNITPNPVVSAAWKHYTVTLSETGGWLTTAGAPPTKDVFKAVLCNITSLSIRGKYTAGTLMSCRLDNVIMGELTVGTAPTITSLTPNNAVPGATVAIAGTGFNTTSTSNIVYFGDVRATVSNATASTVNAVLPQGAAFGRVSVLNTGVGLQAQSMQNFNPTFNNNLDNAGRIIACSMDLKFELALDATANNRGYGNAGDIDGDGLVDIIAVETISQKFSVFRNLGFTGDINASSFAAKVNVSLGAGYNSKGASVIADLDNDGKLDVAVACATTASAFIALFRNTSTPGTISFAPVQYIAASSYSDGSLHAADIDGDGRVELLSAFNNSCGGASAYFSVFQNMSVPGTIEFCSLIDFDNGILCQSNNISTGDLNGDGKLDVIVNSGFDNSFYVFQNTSTPGTVSLAAPFQIDSPGASYSVTIADLDGDGRLDLAWKADSPNEIYIKRNIHTTGALALGSFSADIPIQTPMGSYGAITTADINGDGKPDLVANDDTNLCILQNQSTSGTISFSTGTLFEGYAAGTNPTTPVVADFDKDNKPDVFFGFTALTPTKLAIFRNECFPAPTITSLSALLATPATNITLTGTLMNTGNVTPVVRYGTVAAALGTVSNTSVATVVPTGASYGSVTVTNHALSASSPLAFLPYFNKGTITTTTFSNRTDFVMGNNTGAMAVSDFDNDGRIDVLAEDSARVKIYRNVLAAPGSNISTSTMSLVATQYTGSQQMAVADIDGDNKPDLISSGFVKHNNSSSTPDPISFEANVSTSSSANRLVTNHDFNHDGKMDAAFTDPGNLVRVVENTSRKGPFTILPFGTLQNPVAFTPGGQVLGIDAADFDGDGYDDIAYAVSSGTTLGILKNAKQAGTITTTSFTGPAPVTVGNAPYDVVAADIDQDGLIDLVVTNYNSTFVSILRNTSTAGSISFSRQDITSLGNGYAVRVADMDGDTKPDLVTIHSNGFTPGGSFSFFPNTSAIGTVSFGTRIDYTVPTTPTGLRLADINLDRKPDIIIVRTGNLSIYQNGLPNPVLTVQKQPVDRTVCPGASGTFDADGDGPTTNIGFQWQYGKTSTGSFSNLKESTAYTGTTTRQLTVNAAAGGISGFYRCGISGDFAATVFTTAAKFVVDSVKCATNKPPEIEPAAATTAIGGTVQIGLTSLLSDPDNNLDLSTLTIADPPSSGATATIDAFRVLTVDYTGLKFVGMDTLTIEVCDSLNACTEKQILIQVGSEVVVYNAVSPNNDGKNDVFILEFIDILPATQKNRVSIFNRWGDEVFTINDYNNTTRAFAGHSNDGKPLPTGTYFYKVVFSSGAHSLTGYLELKR